MKQNLDTEAIKASLKQITPGKWYTIGQPWAHSDIADTWVKAGRPDPHISTFVCDCQSVSDDPVDEAQPNFYRPRANAEFIANAPEIMREPIEEVEYLRGVLLRIYNTPTDEHGSEITLAAIRNAARKTLQE